MNSIKTSRRDPNSVVQSGMPVNGGKITKKLTDFVVIEWPVDGVNCSGVLHVSEFPSLDRAERDKMFGVCTIGMPANGLVVLSVSPPKDGKRFSKVRLSALKPIKDALPPQPDGNGGGAGGEPKHRKPSKNRGRNNGNGNGGGKGPNRSAPAAKAAATAGDATVEGAPAPAGASGTGAASAAARNGKPHQGKPRREGKGHDGKGKPQHQAKGKGGGKPANPQPKKEPEPKKVTVPQIVAPSNPVAAARELIASIGQSNETVGDFAALGRTMRLKAATADAPFMSRVRSMQEGLTFIDSCVAQRSELVRAHDDKVLTAASKVHATRKVDARLDEEAKALKSLGARYASLCGQAKKDESKKADADKLKSEIDRRREQLGKDRESNKSVWNDADLELILGAGCGAAGSEDYEALVTAAAQLDKLTTEAAEKTKWLGRMVLRCERFLQPQPEGATVAAATEAQGS